MEDRRQRFPRINLASRNVTELSIQGSFDGAAWSQVRDVATTRVPGVETEVFVSFTGYTARDKERTKHSIAAMIWRADNEPYDLHLSIAFLLVGELGREGSRSTHRESEFLARLESLGAPRTLRARVEFRFDVNDPSKLVVPLPLPLPLSMGGEDAPFDSMEIRGMRVAIPEAERIGWPDLEFILDRPSGREVFFDLKFAIPPPARIVPDLPRVVLNRAATFARYLIRD